MNPGEETVEALLGLVRSPHSPWALLEGSSAEDRFLRELAIQNPLVLKDTFFYSYFRSLRVVDKQVRAGCCRWGGHSPYRTVQSLVVGPQCYVGGRMGR